MVKPKSYYSCPYSTPAAAMPRPYRKHSRVGADDGNEDFWTFAPPPPRRPRKILMNDDDTSGRNSSALTSGGGGGDQSVLLPLASSRHAGELCSNSCTRHVMVYACLAAIACSSMLLARCAHSRNSCEHFHLHYDDIIIVIV